MLPSQSVQVVYISHRPDWLESTDHILSMQEQLLLLVWHSFEPEENEPGRGTYVSSDVVYV